MQNLGAPQGSILAEMNFKIFINDLSENIIPNFFADDPLCCWKQSSLTIWPENRFRLKKQLGFSLQDKF